MDRKVTSNKHDKKETLIPIDDFYALAADEHCWKILKRENHKWRAVKWYSNLENALNGLINFKLRISGVETFAELQAEQKKVMRELSEAVYSYIRGAS